MRPIRALVVGTQYVGLITAAGLAQVGIETVVVPGRPPYDAKHAPLMMSDPSTVPLLHALGMHAPLLRHGALSYASVDTRDLASGHCFWTHDAGRTSLASLGLDGTQPLLSGLPASAIGAPAGIAATPDQLRAAAWDACVPHVNSGLIRVRGAGGATAMPPAHYEPHTMVATYEQCVATGTPEAGAPVRVSFSDGTHEDFDLVLGTDGPGSSVRRDLMRLGGGNPSAKPAALETLWLAGRTPESGVLVEELCGRGGLGPAVYHRSSGTSHLLQCVVAPVGPAGAISWSLWVRPETLPDVFRRPGQPRALAHGEIAGYIGEDTEGAWAPLRSLLCAPGSEGQVLGMHGYEMTNRLVVGGLAMVGFGAHPIPACTFTLQDTMVSALGKLLSGLQPVASATDPGARATALAKALSEYDRTTITMAGPRRHHAIKRALDERHGRPRWRWILYRTSLALGLGGVF